MAKSSIKIITAGMVGGLLSFGLTSIFKPNIPLKISTTNNQPSSTERKNENISKGHYATPVIMPAFESDISFTTAAEKTVNSVVHVTTQYEMVSIRDPFSEFFNGGKALQHKLQRVQELLFQKTDILLPTTML